MKRALVKLFIRKLLYLCGMLLLISLIGFAAVHMAPNSFFEAGSLNPGMTPEAIEKLKSVYGLDKALHIQYLHWLDAIVHLDFGVSFASGRSVWDEIRERVGITVGMNLTAMLLIFFLSMRYGIRSAMRGGLYEKSMKQLSLLSYAMPSFYLALILIMFFGMKLELFPITGIHSIDSKEGLAGWLDVAWHMVLPISVIVFTGFGSMLLYIRSLTKDILESDYIFFAKARGVDEKIGVKHYIIPNLMPFIVTILGLSLPGLLGGSVILEQIFSIDGMGMLFYRSALGRDYPVIMGIMMIGAFLTLLGNMVADLILLKLDPHRER